MPISTAATELVGIEYPIVSAPMDAVAGGRLAAAVSRAGGLGLIGGGYGDETRVGCGFITWSLSTRPQLLDLALAYHPVAVMLSFGDPTPFAEKIRPSGGPDRCTRNQNACAGRRWNRRRSGAGRCADARCGRRTDGNATLRFDRGVDDCTSLRSNYGSHG